MTPIWEKGYRCHGYWLKTVRLGAVTLPPPGFGPIDDYGWTFKDPKDRTGKVHDGRCKTLREGKAIVEQLYRESLT